MSTVLDSGDIARALKRISHEIVEHNHGLANVTLMGIPTRGAFLADRIANYLAGIEVAPPVGTIDTTLHRDDLRLIAPKPLMGSRLPTGGVEGRDIILVDDVLFSGRTIRAALDALGDMGRPRTVQLAVLVDRGHRQLPIRADYVGKNLPTSASENVRVCLQEVDGQDLVEITGGK
jgi:pyrimidine operon attenuation protein/uracil phosphoribosyltransferase